MERWVGGWVGGWVGWVGEWMDLIFLSLLSLTYLGAGDGHAAFQLRLVEEETKGLRVE